ncbi:MAG TPA: hypothetical protein DEB31_04540, partial [Clostridiales bacterium]|nr:hypothetical protein [Clostridiales bacterium]
MDQTCVIGADVGGTFVRIGCVAMDGELIHAAIYKSAAISTGPPKTAIDDLAAFIKQYISELRITDYRGVAIGFPGTLDKSREILYSASNLGENATSRFDGLRIPAGLAAHFDAPVFIGKDTDLLLYSDVHQLGLRTDGMVTGIYFGTGIGASMIYRGETVFGSDGVAGEIGHLPISETGNKCTCNGRGCCESVASGWRLVQLRDEHFPGTPIDDIFTLHHQTVPIKRYIHDCARIVALTGNLLNSEYTVVGGGIVAMKDFPKDAFLAEILALLRHPYPRDTFRLLYSPAGQDAGVLGAAQLIFHKLGERSEIYSIPVKR